MTPAAKSFIQPFLALAIFLLGIGTTRAVTYGTNLLVNGDAEAGPASTTGAPVAVVLRWTVSSAFTVVPYGPADGFPTSLQGPPAGGKKLFAGGNALTSTASQDIDVSANATDIDGGEVVLRLVSLVRRFLGRRRQCDVRSRFQNGCRAGNS